MKIEAIIAELEKRYHMVPRRTIEDPNAFIDFFNFVCEFVGQTMNLSTANFLKSSNDAQFVEARDCVVYLCFKHTKKPIDPIVFGNLIGRHRTTLIAARKRLAVRLKTDKFYKQRFDLLEQNFLLKYNEEKFNLEQRK